MIATVEIPLSQGLVALVDEADLPLVSSRKWCAYSPRPYRTWYAFASIGGRQVSMHRLLTGCTTGDGFEVDHRNGDGLVNTRENLRRCSRAENARNQAKTRGTSRFKGVSWNKATGKWLAQIKVNGRKHALGCFADEAEAARVWNLAAARLHGLFARLNEVN